MIKTATALFGAALLLAVPAAATAQSDAQPRQRVVRTSDLDLFTANGRMELDRRIARAARAVCSDVRSTSRIAESSCLDAAMASGLRQRDRLFAARGLIGDYRSAEVAR